MFETVGLDIIEVRRIEEAIRRWKDRFLMRVFTQAEIEHCRRKRFPGPSFAARFAAKEAVWKVLGLKKGRNPVWSEVEIATDREGAPRVVLRGKAGEIAEGNVIAVSLSHTSEYAAAVAVMAEKT